MSANQGPALVQILNLNETTNKERIERILNECNTAHGFKVG